jgi:phytoene synthase
MSLEKSVFRNGSTTFYFSSKFFPKNLRQDIFKLYSFVRVADDYIDSNPQNKKEFKTLKTLWGDAIEDKRFNISTQKSDSLNIRVVKNMVYLVKKYEINPGLVDAFLASMQADLDKKTYTSLDGILWYVYGSAEAVGLMMTKIMRLPEAAMPYAALQGRAFQWINFIRDINEDTNLGRRYFPAEDLEKFGLKDLKKATIQANPKAFKDFMHFELNRYKKWQREAEEGYKYAPKRLRIPLETAVDSFNWTARKIANNPTEIYDKQIKPKKARVVLGGLKKIF